MSDTPQDSQHADKLFDDINQYFDKIYVITLEGYEDRQNSIKQHFVGLNYEFWPGTDQRKMSKDIMQDKSLYDDQAHKTTKRSSRSMSLGEYCCSMSHLRIYQDMLDKGYKRVLIFEDDAVPVVHKIPNFKKQMASLPEDWDVVLFDYYDHYLPSFSTSLKQWVYRLYHKLHIANWHIVPPILIDRLAMRDYNEYFYLPGKLSGAHAYAMSAKAAEHYIAYQTPVKLQADRPFYYYQAEQQLKEFASKDPMFDTGEVANRTTI